jgi:tetratricopeptide (TPR) repeat protein
VAGRAPAGSDGWCAAHVWLGQAAMLSADPAGALGYYTAVRDALIGRPPSRMLADCLRGRSGTLANLGRVAEAVDDGRRALILSRELGYPAGVAMALAELGMAALFAGDQAGAVRLAQQAEQAAAGIPGWMARLCSIILTDALLAAGDLAAAEDVCAAGLARSRQAGDLQSQAALLTQTADLDLQAGRVEDAAVHLREALQITGRTGSGMELLNDLDYCGHLCAQTRRYAEALTLWAAYAALLRHEGYADPPPYARRRPGPLREAQQALGHARVRVAEEEPVY